MSLSHSRRMSDPATESSKPDTQSLERLGQSIAIRSTNWLGDVVMTLPAVEALCQSLPSETKVTVLAQGKLSQIWEAVDGVNDVISITRKLSHTRKQLKELNPDSIIVFPNSFRTGLEPWLAGVPFRAGFTGHWRKQLLHHTFQKPRAENGVRHQTNDYLDLVHSLGAKRPQGLGTLPKLTRPAPPPLEKIKKKEKGEYIAVCPGAEYGPAKRWPVDRFAKTLEGIQKETSLPVVILGSPGDASTGEELSSKLKDSQGGCFDLTGKTSLSEFMSWMTHAQLVLCNDSGSMHLAAAFRRPTIALFGSTEPALTGPLGDSVKVFREHVSCSPCFLRDCPIDFRCMHAIDPEEVIECSLRTIKEKGQK